MAVRWAELQSPATVHGLTGVGPVERVRHRVVVVLDELPQLRLKVTHRGEVAAADRFAIDHSEHRFNLVQPRTVFGRIDKADAMLLRRQELTTARLVLEHATLAVDSQVVCHAADVSDKRHQLSRRMNVEVVRNDDPLARRGDRHQFAEMSREIFLRASGTDARSDDFATDDIQIGDQCGRAVPDVFVLVPSRLIGLHRLTGSTAFQRLQPRHFVEGNSTHAAFGAQSRCVEIVLQTP